MVDIVEKMKEVRVIYKEEMKESRRYGDGEELGRPKTIIWNEEIGRKCGVVDIAEKVKEARLRWYEHVIRRHEEEPIRDMD